MMVLLDRSQGSRRQKILSGIPRTFNRRGRFPRNTTIHVGWCRRDRPKLLLLARSLHRHQRSSRDWLRTRQLTSTFTSFLATNTRSIQSITFANLIISLHSGEERCGVRSGLLWDIKALWSPRVLFTVPVEPRAQLTVYFEQNATLSGDIRITAPTSWLVSYCLTLMEGVDHRWAS